MQIGNLNIDGILFLAPLAGVSNHPFRILARRYGADFCYTEMISADAIVRNQKKTLNMVDISPDEHLIGLQLFGSSPEIIARAVACGPELGADLIDLNLGCPVKKVVRRNGGAALLKDLSLTSEIMAAAVENAALPVTIKMRTGWDTEDEAFLEVSKMAEKCGVSAVTLHARSRSAGFSGKSDWSKIAQLKREISIPVIGNGDINSPHDAKAIISQTGCDAIMIGRAAMKNPHILRQIKDFITLDRTIPDLTIKQKVELALEHSCLMIEKYGEKVGTLKMRKHLAWYSHGFPDGASLRRQLNQISGYSDICNLFSEFQNARGADIEDAFNPESQ